MGLYDLVGGDWNMTGLFFHSVGNVIFPIDELIFFRGVKTTNQLMYVNMIWTMTMLLMGQLTISTGPLSSSQTVSDINHVRPWPTLADPGRHGSS